MDYTNTLVCWGDSITEGMAMRDKSYPTVLGKLLGDEYKVINAGDGGEDTITIMARQGALKLFTENEIVFGEGEETVAIGNQDNNGFIGGGTSINTIAQKAKMLCEYRSDNKDCMEYMKKIC